MKTTVSEIPVTSLIFIHCKVFFTYSHIADEKILGISVYILSQGDVK